MIMPLANEGLVGPIFVNRELTVKGCYMVISLWSTFADNVRNPKVDNNSTLSLKLTCTFPFGQKKYIFKDISLKILATFWSGTSRLLQGEHLATYIRVPVNNFLE